MESATITYFNFESGVSKVFVSPDGEYATHVTYTTQDGGSPTTVSSTIADMPDEITENKTGPFCAQRIDGSYLIDSDFSIEFQDDYGCPLLRSMASRSGEMRSNTYFLFAKFV